MTPRERVDAALSPALERYRRLPPRDRRMLGLLAVVVGFTVLLLIWQAAARARTRNETTLADARALGIRIEALAGRQLASQGPGTVPSGQRNSPLLVIVDQASRESAIGKPPVSLTPDGDHRVRLAYEDIPFDELARWLGGLKSHYGVLVAEADITPRPDAGPGQVGARLTLERP